MNEHNLVARIEEALSKTDVEKLWNLVAEIEVACETDDEVDELCRDVFHLALELGSEVGLQTLLSSPVISSRRLIAFYLFTAVCLWGLVFER